MTGKLLFAISLIAAASTSAFSMEIVKGKLIQHKEWTTGKGAAVFSKEISLDRKKLASMLPQKSNNNATFIATRTRMNLDESMGTTIQPVGVESHFNAFDSVFVYNFTSDNKKIYTITTSVCTMEDPEVPLPPNQVKDDPQ